MNYKAIQSQMSKSRIWTILNRSKYFLLSNQANTNYQEISFYCNIKTFSLDLSFVGHLFVKCYLVFCFVIINIFHQLLTVTKCHLSYLSIWNFGSTQDLGLKTTAATAHYSKVLEQILSSKQSSALHFNKPQCIVLVNNYKL